MLTIDEVINNKVYRISDDNYTVERCNVLLNCIRKFELTVLDYKITLSVKHYITDNELYSYDFQVFNLDEDLEDILMNVDTLFKDVLNDLKDKNWEYKVSVLGLKEFSFFTLKEEYIDGD